MTSAPFEFGTKAETLSRLRSRLKEPQILDLVYFPVTDWQNHRRPTLRKIRTNLGNIPLIVRSSTAAEDTAQQSMAGRWDSRLDVDGSSDDEIAKAIDEVISSYPGDPNDQVLVQPMLRDVILSGVIFTHSVTDGAPYYVIGYDDESGKTDSVTGGRGIHKTVLIFHGAEDHHIESSRVISMLKTVKAVEKACGNIPIDIEFGMARAEKSVLFQARPLTTTGSWKESVGPTITNCIQKIEQLVSAYSEPRPGIVGTETILGIMPDWNPAEMIGTTPTCLAISLYREIITERVWRDARAEMGYRNPRDEELMLVLYGHPYIDVRNSFNSLLPASLPDETAEQLVNSWLDRLGRYPELHDKVEFEVAQTCADFCLEIDFNARNSDRVSRDTFETFKSHLVPLTRRCLDLESVGSLAMAEKQIYALAADQKSRFIRHSTKRNVDELLLQASDLLEECKKSGTRPFSILARHAFIAEALLRSAIRRGAIEADRLSAFKRSIRTVSSELSDDFDAVLVGRLSSQHFMTEYGHLRPGTYNIESPRYSDRGDLFDVTRSRPSSQIPYEFKLTSNESHAISQLLKESGLDVLEASSLFEYARRAIVGREYGKFIFTRNLSDALESFAEWGAQLGFSREDLRHVDYKLINPINHQQPNLDCARLHELIERGRETHATAQSLKMSYIIRGAGDVYVIPLHRSAPNFFGSGRIEAPVILVYPASSTSIDLSGKLVCLENADPGFDWIFTKNIAGLITKYGGTNSHMAIRCVEFGLPAAIGCGEQAFSQIVTASTVELDLTQNTLRPVHVH